MSIPKLKKIKSEKKYHDLTLSDEYAWVDQPNILEVLKDASKLDSEVKDYISGTYRAHYNSGSGIQTLDLINSCGDAEAFCRSNILKY